MSNGLLSSEYCTFCYKVLEFIFVIFSISFYYYLPYLSKTDVKKLVIFNRADNGIIIVTTCKLIRSVLISKL